MNITIEVPNGQKITVPAKIGSMLSTTVVVLISGKIGAGKSTLGKALFSTLSEDYTMIYSTHFAKELKYIAKNFFGWDGVKDRKGRILLQELGKTGRNYNEDVWAESVANELTREFPILLPDIVIIDDWRFKNEYDYFKSRDFNVVAVRIIRDGWSITVGDLIAQDVSETSLDDNFNYDIVINNYNLKDFDAYAEEIKNYIKTLQGG